MKKMCYNKYVNRKPTVATSRKVRVVPMGQDIEQFHIPHPDAGQDGKGMDFPLFQK